MEPNAKGVVHTARRLPVALKERDINKLHEMEANGCIVEVTELTEWVCSMVVSIQGVKVRICIDPSDLNKVIKREHYLMRTIAVISTTPYAKVFSKLDAKSGFVCSKPVLKYFDVKKPAKIQCDAGLSAVLIQDGQPVTYSSRSLTDAEGRYAEIEK